MDDTEKRTRIARALGIAEGWMVADGVDMSTSTNPRIVRLMGLADVAIEAAGDDATIAALRAELAADRRAVMDALGGGITDASLKERILALRAERDEYRGELAARTEELAKAKAELAFVRSIYGEAE